MTYFRILQQKTERGDFKQNLNLSFSLILLTSLYVTILAWFPDVFVLSCCLQLKTIAIRIGKRAHTDLGPGYDITKVNNNKMNVDFSLYPVLFDNTELNNYLFEAMMIEKHDLRDDIRAPEHSFLNAGLSHQQEAAS